MFLSHFPEDVLESFDIDDVDAPSIDFDVVLALEFQGFEDGGLIFLKATRRAREQSDFVELLLGEQGCGCETDPGTRTDNEEGGHFW
jgi:hypothetical protein